MRWSFVLLCPVAASLFAQQSPVREIRYRSVPDFPSSVPLHSAHQGHASEKALA